MHVSGQNEFDIESNFFFFFCKCTFVNNNANNIHIRVQNEIELQMIKSWKRTKTQCQPVNPLTHCFVLSVLYKATRKKIPKNEANKKQHTITRKLGFFLNAIPHHYFIMSIESACCKVACFNRYEIKNEKRCYFIPSMFFVNVTRLSIIMFDGSGWMNVWFEFNPLFV